MGTRWVWAAVAAGLIAGCSGGNGTSEAQAAAEQLCVELEAERDPQAAADLLREAAAGTDVDDPGAFDAAVDERCGALVAALNAPPAAAPEPEPEPEEEPEPAPAPEEEPDEEPEDEPAPAPEPEEDPDVDVAAGEVVSLGDEIDCDNVSLWRCSLLELQVVEACWSEEFDHAVIGRMRGELVELDEDFRESGLGDSLFQNVYPRLFGSDGVIYEEDSYGGDCHVSPMLIDLPDVHAEGTVQDGWFAIPAPQSAIDGGRVQVGYRFWDWP